MCHCVREGEANAPSQTKTPNNGLNDIMSDQDSSNQTIRFGGHVNCLTENLFDDKSSCIEVIKRKTRFAGVGTHLPQSTPSSLPLGHTQSGMCIVLKMVRQQIVLAALSKKMSQKHLLFASFASIFCFFWPVHLTDTTAVHFLLACAQQIRAELNSAGFPVAKHDMCREQTPARTHLTNK